MPAVDAVVVGGSFAGLACARAAAAAGARVVVLDRKAEPGADVRTTGILVQEVVDALRPPAALIRPIPGVRLYAPSGRPLDLQSRDYAFAATDTPGLLRWLAAGTAAAGAECRWGAAFSGAERTATGWRLPDHGLEARWLIGADGATSRVARALGLGRNAAVVGGVEVECEGIRGLAPDRLHCWLDSRLAPGYLAWAIPGVGVTQVGLACRSPHRPDLAGVWARLAAVADVSRARVVARRAGLIPVGGPLRRWRVPGAFLLGDAAGHVSPLTAGGIHSAWRLGGVAGAAVAAASRGGPDPADAVAAAAPRYRAKRWLRWALDLRPPNALLDALLATPPIRALAQAVFFHHRGLATRAAWRDCLRAALAGEAPASA